MNYTPLDVDKFQVDQKNNKLNTILLGVASFTSLVFVVLLFVLIQKKLQTPVTTSTKANEIEEVILPTAEPTLTPQPTLTETPTASVSSTLQPVLSPTVKVSTVSPTLKP